MNTALARAKAALYTLTVPVYLAEFLDTDSDGFLVLPDDKSFIVLHGITAVPTFEWANYSYDGNRIQVNAYSRVEGTPSALLTAAKPLLTAARFRPGVTTNLGRDGPYTAMSQDWEVNT